MNQLINYFIQRRNTMKTTKTTTKGGEKTPSQCIEHPMEEYNNNVYKDSVFMSSCIHKFSDMEIKFMMNHLNNENVFFDKVTRQTLMDIEVKFILEFISKIKIAEYGQLIRNVIQLKLLNQI
jgi:hypothetical protein